jgi:hypothetical protein
MIQPTQNSQQAPARVLLDLLTEHPELPQLSWNIDAADTTLYATGNQTALAAWTAVLGVEPMKPLTFQLASGEQLTSHRLIADWRGVRISAGFYAPASADLAGAVAA